MFSVHCPTHGTEVLLSERRIEAIRAAERRPPRSGGAAGAAPSARRSSPG